MQSAQNYYLKKYLFEKFSSPPPLQIERWSPYTNLR